MPLGITMGILMLSILFLTQPFDIAVALAAAVSGYLLIGFGLQLGYSSSFDYSYEANDILTAPLGALLDMIVPVHGPIRGYGWHWRKRQAQMIIYRLAFGDTPGNLTWRQTLRDVTPELFFKSLIIAGLVVIAFFFLLALLLIPATFGVDITIAGARLYLWADWNKCIYYNLFGWEITNCPLKWIPRL